MESVQLDDDSHDNMGDDDDTSSSDEEDEWIEGVTVDIRQTSR